VVPIVEVASPVGFALKISATVVGLNLAGVALYLRGRTRRRSAITASG
jgi:hypothetical protein